MEKRLLLVEDEVLLAMAKQQELARYNYETSHVTTGEKAVDLISQGDEPIDLILMDIDLGRGMDGTEAARQILEYKEIPIVFLSSHEEPEVVEKTEKISSYGYVVKTSSITVLDASIKMAFKLFESQNTLEQELQERTILKEKLIVDEKRTKTLLQESPICTKIVDTDFNLQFMSDAGFRMLELDKSEEAYGKPYPFAFFPADFRTMMIDHLEESKASKKITHNTGRTNNVKGDEVYLQSTIVPILDEHKEIDYFIVFSIDMTEQSLSRKKLKKSEEQYRNLFENTMHEVHLWKLVRDEQGMIKTWRLAEINPAALNAWGRTRPEIIGKTTDEIFSYDVTEQFMPIVKKIFSEGTPCTWEAYFPPTGQFLYMTSVPFGEYFMSTGLDISGRKQAEEALKASYDLLNATQRIAGVGGWKWDIATDKVTWSEELYTITGLDPDYPPPQFNADHHKIYTQESWQMLTQAVDNTLKNGQPYEIYAQIVRPDGVIRDVFIHGGANLDNEGSISGLFGIVEDITERQRAEEKLREALKEKDFLMKELNHRVKNSLLMVSSLISLKDLETETDLSDIQHQIKAISLIHEKLYQTERVTEIYCRDYFNDLLSSIFLSFSKRSVKLEANIDEIYLPTKTAMSLGLVINEIATNAIKHGFTDNEEAVFLIKMEENKEKNQYELNLSNTGNPFPEAVDIESVNTLGLRLINALVAQLDGTVELQRKPNPVFTIKIPMEIE